MNRADRYIYKNAAAIATEKSRKKRKPSQEEQNVDGFLSERNIRYAVEYKYDTLPPWGSADDKPVNHYVATFDRDGKKPLVVPFYDSIANSYMANGPAWDYMTKVVPRSGSMRIAPSAYDILVVVEKYDVGTFEEFCSDFGYDSDSRNAEQRYFAVQKESAEVRRFFTEDEIDELSDMVQ